MIETKDIRDIVLIISGIIAVVSLILSFAEYKRQGSQKRAEYFLEMRNMLKTNPRFQNIVNMLEKDAQQLSEVPFIDKRDFLGSFEEVALLMNSRIIRKEVAYHMFGYDSIRCWESEYFWDDVNRESRYWGLFKRFAVEMKKLEGKKPPNFDKLRF